MSTVFERHLDWDGCFKVRDLGGLPTTDGHATRWGVERPAVSGRQAHVEAKSPAAERGAAGGPMTCAWPMSRRRVSAVGQEQAGLVMT
jgi:hypothetical protein